MTGLNDNKQAYLSNSMECSGLFYITILISEPD